MSLHVQKGGWHGPAVSEDAVQDAVVEIMTGRGALLSSSAVYSPEQGSDELNGSIQEEQC